MKYAYDHGVITVTNLQNYNIDQIFDCGQCFRFSPTGDGGWSGVAYRRPLTLRQPDSHTLQISGIDEEEFVNIFARFLCLEDDYDAIRVNIRAHFGQDAAIETAMAYGEGIRLLKQEPWEALCSFILSQNNNIPRIKKMIETLCRQCGAPIGGDLFAFPTPEALLVAGPAILRHRLPGRLFAARGRKRRKRHAKFRRHTRPPFPRGACSADQAARCRAQSGRLCTAFWI